MSEKDAYFRTILLPPLQRLVSQLERYVAENNPAIDKLLELNRAYSRIADLGCGSGTGTLALMLRLGAEEVIGIDKDGEKVSDASRQLTTELLGPLQEGIRKTKSLFVHCQADTDLSDDIRQTVAQLINRFGDVPVPQLREGDITEGRHCTGLPDQYFDLVYCRYVLYHIYCGDHRSSFVRTKSAVQEMARLAKPGGLVVAYEPNTCSDDDSTDINLARLLDMCGALRPMDQEVLGEHVPPETVYIYERAGSERDAEGARLNLPEVRLLQLPGADGPSV
jgi:SAM-dependent methyltransferase